MIDYFTDGSASPNPGPGGYAVIKNRQPYMIGGEPSGETTTNIRMEGFAIVTALKDADGQPCQISTDSEFWINVITKWAPAWQKNGWRKKGGDIKNLDIVQAVVPLYQASQAKLVWVRGHVGNELNELADVWANKAREQGVREPIAVSDTAAEKKQSETAETRTWRYLTEAKTMQLATSQDNQPWAASVYFVVDAASQTMCWLSEPGRKHSQQLKVQPRASFAVAVETETPVVGVQGSGLVQLVSDGAVAERVLKSYHAKYQQGENFMEHFRAGTNKHYLYALRIDALQLFDERNETEAPLRII